MSMPHYVLIKVPGLNGHTLIINLAKIMHVCTVMDEVNVSDCINDIANGKQVVPKEYSLATFEDGSSATMDISIDELFEKIRENS